MKARDSRLDDFATCAECGGYTELDPCAGDGGHDEGFDRCACEVKSTALTLVPAPRAELVTPYRYEVQLSLGWRVPCETFRRALEVSRGQAWCRIVAWDYVAIDEDDDGLSDDEQLAISLGDCELRDALVAVIDGAAGKAA